MARRNYDLPSLKMIGTFEAAARAGSFKDAADELGVTPGAVSHQIRGLEAELGMNLFIRQSRAVELSTEGRTLFEVVNRSLGEIDQTVRKLRALSETGQVSIGSTTAVSSLWLTPLISQFWREHPDIQINQEVRDRPFRRPLNLDLTIEYAVNAPNEIADVLFEDRLLPLCSPHFKERHINSLDQLAAAPLIHLDAKETNWTSWPNWFASLGFDGELVARHRVNNYAIALQLARDGLGVVLGWKGLVDSLTSDGRLVPLTDFEIEAPGRFYLIPSSQKPKPQTKVVSDWLLAQNR
jgi:LysR family glycine cleavage system transcriptional activator